MTSSPTARRAVPAEHRDPRGALPALAVDLLLTLLFVALGQGQHATERGPLGLLVTAAPFLAGLLLMTGLTSGHRTWARVWPHGVIVWMGTVAVGMIAASDVPNAPVRASITAPMPPPPTLRHTAVAVPADTAGASTASEGTDR